MDSLSDIKRYAPRSNSPCLSLLRAVLKIFLSAGERCRHSTLDASLACSMTRRVCDTSSRAMHASSALYP
eukprot:4888496-Karenia_brevis.AAC.1